MRDEVYVKLDPVTRQLMQEERFPNHLPVDNGGVLPSGRSLVWRPSPRLWKDAGSNAATDLGLKPRTTDTSLHMIHGNLKLKLQQFLVKKVGYLNKVGNVNEILGQKWRKQSLSTTSSDQVDIFVKI